MEDLKISDAEHYEILTRALINRALSTSSRPRVILCYLKFGIAGICAFFYRPNKKPKRRKRLVQTVIAAGMCSALTLAVTMVSIIPNFTFISGGAAAGLVSNVSVAAEIRPGYVTPLTGVFGNRFSLGYILPLLAGIGSNRENESVSVNMHASTGYDASTDYVAMQDIQMEEPMNELVAEPLALIDESIRLEESAGSYIWPADGPITSLFGYRDTTIGSLDHKGLDIGGSFGQLIFASDGGEVIFSDIDDNYGLVVRIRHDNGDITLYAHCSSLLVREGERVWQGQEIARMGLTGVTNGVHVHFELIIDDVNVDPLNYLMW